MGLTTPGSPGRSPSPSLVSPVWVLVFVLGGLIPRGEVRVAVRVSLPILSLGLGLALRIRRSYQSSVEGTTSARL